MDIHIKTPLNLNSMAAFKTGPDIIISAVINQQKNGGNLFLSLDTRIASLL